MIFLSCTQKFTKSILEFRLKNAAGIWWRNRFWTQEFLRIVTPSVQPKTLTSRYPFQDLSANLFSTKFRSFRTVIYSPIRSLTMKKKCQWCFWSINGLLWHDFKIFFPKHRPKVTPKMAEDFCGLSTNFLLLKLKFVNARAQRSTSLGNDVQ